ncbi:hypothetical protein F5I97DRAFT_724576 [Phlebopus sp. FC_14]|nr:hypothetical protein F5I97DRAFT_724576 [Phlebopus sp. FC_14]
MVRGRKKDYTIPPSRALTQQRDYRARKAQYVQELQQRCARAEEENVRLRRELDIIRTAAPPNVLSPDVMVASNDLMQHLAAMSASISRFQRVAEQSNTFSLSPPPGTYQRMYPYTHTSHSSQPRSSSLRPAVFSSPFVPSSQPTSNRGPPPSQVLPHSLSKLMDPQPDGRPISPIRSPRMSPTPSLGSECCGGYVDCSEWAEEEECEGSQQHSQEFPRTRRTPPA